LFKNEIINFNSKKCCSKGKFYITKPYKPNKKYFTKGNPSLAGAGGIIRDANGL
jgi:hypothetical protein